MKKMVTLWIMVLLLVFPLVFAQSTINDILVAVTDNPGDFTVVHGQAATSAEIQAANDLASHYGLAVEEESQDMLLEGNLLVVGTNASSMVIDELSALSFPEYGIIEVNHAYGSKLLIGGAEVQPVVDAVDYIFNADSSQLDVPFERLEGNQPHEPDTLGCVSDSDGGAFDVAGFVVLDVGGELHDSCQNEGLFSGYLVEYQCDGGTFEVEMVPCADECYDGACTQAGTTALFGSVYQWVLQQVSISDVLAQIMYWS